MTAPLWTAATGAEIGADWLERELAPAADFGRRARESERAFRRGDEAAARAAIGRVAAVAGGASPETLAALREAIAACPDPTAAVVRARADVVLGDDDFFELARFCGAVARVRSLAVGDAFAGVEAPPLAAGLAALLETGRTRDRSFYLADAYDEDLARARGRAATRALDSTASVAGSTARVAAFAGVDHVRDGEFVLMRDRASGPLPPEIHVLREAPTYFLCEVALDDAALAALGEADAAGADVARREEGVRARLTAEVAWSAAALDDAARALGALDSLVAKAQFAQRYDARVPTISADPTLAFSQARLLPLRASLAQHAHRYVPLSIALDGVGVLTGPNMGGKSAALRTCGFLAACVALGVPVPAEEASVPLFDRIAWIGGGEGWERTTLLSSFGRDVSQVRDALGGGAGRTLALVDEFARTTSPREGRALLIALLEALRARGAVALAATHLSGIAADARVAHYAVAGLREPPKAGGAIASVDDAIDRIAEVMDFRVSRVDENAEPRADALALAEVLGLDAALVARAREVL